MLPVYGKRGSLAQVEKMNKQKISDINRIFAGNKLRLPSHLVSQGLRSQKIKIVKNIEVVWNVRKIASVETDRENEIPTDKSEPTPTLPASTIEVKENADVSIPAKQIPTIAPKERAAQSLIELKLGSGYSRIDSTMMANNATAVALSKPVASIDIDWRHLWCESYETFMSGSYRSISYQDSSSGSLRHPNVSLSSFSLGVSKNFGVHSKFSLEGGAREEIIIASYQAGIANLDLIPLKFFKASYVLDLLQVRDLKMTASLGAAYILQNSNGAYNINAGSEYSVGLRITHYFKHLALFGVGQFSQTDQNTSFSTQNRKEVNAQFGFVFQLGGGFR